MESNRHQRPHRSLPSIYAPLKRCFDTIERVWEKHETGSIINDLKLVALGELVVAAGDKFVIRVRARHVKLRPGSVKGVTDQRVIRQGHGVKLSLGYWIQRVN